MKRVLGIIIAITGVCASLYLGGWIMFVGGIAGLIDIIKLGDFEGVVIAKNIAKIVFASATTSVGVYLSIFIGSSLIYGANRKRRFRRF